MFQNKGDIMIESINTFFDSLPKELLVFIMSMTPLIELRGGIPFAYLLGFPLPLTLVLTIVGNMIPVPFILLFIKHIFKFLRDHNIMTNVINKVTSRAMARSHKVENLEFWGLVLFVGIPLPGTGAWTGALIASLLNIPFKKAITAIFLGILIAATIMSLGVYGVIEVIF